MSGSWAESRPRVLVLMAAFNGSLWIKEQVDTILGQIDVDVELIISDDGSTDGSREFIKRFANDPRVHIVCPPAATGAAAQNFLWLIRATSAERFDFIALADQDDVWHRDRIIRACVALAKSGAQGYSSATNAFWSSGRTNVLTQVDKITRSDFLFEGAGQGCTYVLDQKFYAQLRKFFLDHRAETARLHYHDWAIYALSRIWILTWIFDAKPGLEYRQHNENDTGARTSLMGVRRRISRIRNGWYLTQLSVIANVCFSACPDNALISEWQCLLDRPRTISRRAGIAMFCLKGGRRRLADRLISIAAAMVGWI